MTVKRTCKVQPRWAGRAHRFGQAAGARERDVLLLARWPPKAAARAAGGCWRQHVTAGGQWGASLAIAAERRHGPVVRGQQPRPAGPERHAARGAARTNSGIGNSARGSGELWKGALPGCLSQRKGLRVGSCF